MKRQNPLQTRLLNGVEWSRDLRWRVTMNCDHMGNVTGIDTMATYGYFPNETHGHASQRVNPFDDLGTIIGTLMVDAAVHCSEQLVLFHEP